MTECAQLMCQVPSGGGYSMSLPEVMELDTKWRNHLLDKLEDWLEEYKNAMEK